MITDLLKNKNILISGGAGFIGSNLAERLAEIGANVLIIDSLIPTYGGNLQNIAQIKDRVKLNISDVRDEFSMRYLVQNQDYLFSLAGQNSHLDSMHDPFTDLEINTRAQLSILETIRRYNPGIKIVYTSTRQVYGRPHYLPVDEKHPLQPVDVNGINKLAGEYYYLLYNNVYGIHASVLRLTNTFGPRMRIKDARQTFLGVWIRNLIEGRRIEVWGGDQLRDFTYVDDVVDALLISALSEEANGRVYNLGGERPISLKDLAELLILIHGKGEFMIREFPTDRKQIDIGDYYADARLIEASLGWKNSITIEEGLSRTLDYYRTHIADYV